MHALVKLSSSRIDSATYRRILANSAAFLGKAKKFNSTPLEDRLHLVDDVINCRDELMQNLYAALEVSANNSS